MTTFLIIGAVGLAILLTSLIVGEFLDGLFDFLGGDLFSTAAAGAFVSAFGFGGALAVGALGTGPAVMVGALAGVLFAWLALWLTRMLRSGHTDGTPSNEATIGLDAVVITAIPVNGFGVVRVVLGGHTVTYNARSFDDNVAIESDTPVHVTGVLSPTAVTVAPNWRSVTSTE